MLAAMPPTSPTPVNRDEAPARAAARAAVRAPVRERGDACPGALRLHAADDGRLARLRLPAGILTDHQAEVLASAAERLGDGHLDITSRGNVQLRGLADACGGVLAELLYGAGLLPSQEHERVRNIVASPLAGLDRIGGLASVDAQLWARELDKLLCASEAAKALSGRFLFALDDGRGDVAALGADVTLLARRDARDAQPVERPGGAALLRIGVNRSGLRLDSSDAPRAALLAAETFLTVAEASGSGAWRVRELPAGQDHDPGPEDLEAAVAARLAEAGIAAEYVAEATTPQGAPPAPGLVRSPDGTVALSVYATLGRLSAAQWRLLSTAAAETERGELRVTPWRGVIVPGLDPAAADDLLDRLRAAGLITSPDSPWHGVGACTGRPGCAKALSDVRSDAAGAVAMTDTPGGLPVHWSGCARRCGHPQGGSVDVVATGEGSYEISVRGTLVTTATVTATVTATRTDTRTATTDGPELADAVATARTTPLTR
ncbi:precorrin-3B synthase [Streptomyces sp. NPDC088116]|uniref:precorrin-3B synthase n=1 Tax=Streptomyces sp. NPDC088116 TaxID=3365825 RepID=UPI00382C0F64